MRFSSFESLMRLEGLCRVDIADKEGAFIGLAVLTACDRNLSVTLYEFLHLSVADEVAAKAT